MNTRSFVACQLFAAMVVGRDTWEPETGYKLQMWTTDNNTVINMEATVPDQTYFGILFGKSMTNSDTIIFQADGTSSTYADYWSTGHSAPTKDTVQNVTCTSKVEGTDVIYSCTRPIDTMQDQDSALALDQQFDISYAINTNTSNI